MERYYEDGSGRAGASMRGSLHTESHAGIFGLSLAALFAACLVLSAAASSTRICQPSDRDFGGIKACTANQDGEEPGYR